MPTPINIREQLELNQTQISERLEELFNPDINAFLRVPAQQSVCDVSLPTDTPTRMAVEAWGNLENAVSNTTPAPSTVGLDIDWAIGEGPSFDADGDTVTTTPASTPALSGMYYNYGAIANAELEPCSVDDIRTEPAIRSTEQDINNYFYETLRARSGRSGVPTSPADAIAEIKKSREEKRDCECCGKSRKNSRAISGKWICSRCVKELYFRCHLCNKFFTKDQENTHEERCYCPSCFEYIKNNKQCSFCGNYKPNGEILVIKRQDVCLSCKEEFIRVNAIRPYGKTHVMSFNTANNEPKRDVLFLGLEMEIGGTGNVKDSRELAINEVDKMMFSPDSKFDSSVCDEGFEIAFQPATLRAWKSKEAQEKLGAFLSEATRIGFAGHNKGAIHIHINREYITGFDLAKLFKFIYDPQNYLFILRTSQRTKDTLARWASTSDIKPTDFIKIASNKKRQDNRRTAININTDFGTFEFRIFNSTLKLNRFNKNLEFVDSTINWIKDIGYNDVTIENYLNYVIKNRKTYRNLYEFYKEIEIITTDEKK